MYYKTTVRQGEGLELEGALIVFKKLKTNSMEITVELPVGMHLEKLSVEECEKNDELRYLRSRSDPESKYCQ